MDPLIRGDLALAIPTYRRPVLLRRLLEGVCTQSELPGFVVVVDGSSNDGTVRTVMSEFSWSKGMKAYYLPSNHANLPYQRLVGYLAIDNIPGARYLLYLDDDLVPSNIDSVAQILSALDSEPEIVGASATIIMGDPPSGEEGYEAVKIREEVPGISLRSLMRHLGKAARLQPGGLTPVGHRVQPDETAEVASVKWLRGGVMACRLDALSPECFPFDLLAMAEIGAGLGEDTILALRLGGRGRLCMVRNARFDHPHSAPPEAYAREPYDFGLAVASSRRLINDNYRYPESPTLADRIALIRGLAGGCLAAAIKAMMSPSSRSIRYSAGYLMGSLRALAAPPRNSRLSPGVAWMDEARTVLRRVDQIYP